MWNSSLWCHVDIQKVLGKKVLEFGAFQILDFQIRVAQPVISQLDSVTDLITFIIPVSYLNCKEVGAFSTGCFNNGMNEKTNYIKGRLLMTGARMLGSYM
jgi:hypothetical protein